MSLKPKPRETATQAKTTSEDSSEPYHHNPRQPSAGGRISPLPCKLQGGILAAQCQNGAVVFRIPISHEVSGLVNLLSPMSFLL